MSTDARDARGLPEDGFHEIQLSGKQLVFLFMATTVVSIVIFLCGVLVGRGVRADVPAGVATPQPVERAAELVPAPWAPAAKPDAPPVEEPTPTTEDLSYYDRLGANAPASERVAPGPDGGQAGGARGAASKDAAKAAPAASPKPAAAAPAASTAPAPAPAAAAEAPPASGGRYTVQVAAVRTRSEADVIAKRLTGRGYPAYVDASSGRGAKMYRVRVGAFKDRTEAEPVRQRLEKDEKFKPWVTTR